MGKKSKGKRKHGSSKQQCPLKKGSLLVLVQKSTSREPVKDVKVTITPTGQSKTTEKHGMAEFKELDPNTYEVALTLAKLAEDHSVAGPEKQRETVARGSQGFCLFELRPLGLLDVKVLRADTRAALGGVKVRIEIGGATAGEVPTAEGTGVAPFKKLKAGKYRVVITSLGSHAAAFAVPPSVSATVPAGGKGEAILQVDPSGWIEIELVEAGTDPAQPVSEVSVKAKLPGDIVEAKSTREEGLVRFDKLPAGTVAIEELVLEPDVWQVVED